MKPNEKRILLESKLTECSWKQDKYGHFKSIKSVKNKITGELKSVLYRIKMQSISYRVERQVIYDNGQTAWVKVNGAYFREIIIKDDELLAKPFRFPL